MRRVLIYDLPVRLFHWMFAGLFLFSFAVGKVVDDESQLFVYHMLSGLLMAALVLWRLLWGLIGCEHSRFSNFSLNPIDLKDYFFSFISGVKRKWDGHNPASSWAAIVMFIFALGLAGTGVLMTTGSKESYEDIHELLANAFILTVILHIAGIVLHTFRHRDGIGFSMIDGKKELESGKTSIASSRGLAAFLLVLWVGLSAFYLVKNFNPQTGELKILGASLNLADDSGDQEGHEGHNSDDGRDESHDND